MIDLVFARSRCASFAGHNHFRAVPSHQGRGDHTAPAYSRFKLIFLSLRVVYVGYLGAAFVPGFGFGLHSCPVVCCGVVWEKPLRSCGVGVLAMLVHVTSRVSCWGFIFWSHFKENQPSSSLEHAIASFGIEHACCTPREYGGFVEMRFGHVYCSP